MSLRSKVLIEDLAVRLERLAEEWWQGVMVTRSVERRGRRDLRDMFGMMDVMS